MTETERQGTRSIFTVDVQPTSSMFKTMGYTMGYRPIWDPSDFTQNPYEESRIPL